MSLAATNYINSVGLADALQWPPWGRRHAPPHPALDLTGERAAAENIANAPLGRPVNQRARPQRTSDVAENDHLLQLQADSQSPSLSPAELDSHPIAYTSGGGAIHETLPRGVFLDIVA